MEGVWSLLLYRATNDASRQPPFVAPFWQQRESQKSKWRFWTNGPGPALGARGGGRKHPSLPAKVTLGAQPRIVNPVNTLLEGRKSTVYYQRQLSIRKGGSGE